METVKLNGRTFTISTKKYANCYVTRRAFNALVEARGISIDEYCDDNIDVRGASTIQDAIDEYVEDMTDEDVYKLLDCKKLLNDNIVQYILFIEEV